MNDEKETTLVLIAANGGAFHDLNQVINHVPSNPMQPVEQFDSLILLEGLSAQMRRAVQ